MQRSFRLHLCYTTDVPYSLSFNHLDSSIANLFIGELPHYCQRNATVIITNRPCMFSICPVLLFGKFVTDHAVAYSCNVGRV